MISTGALPIFSTFHNRNESGTDILGVGKVQRALDVVESPPQISDRGLDDDQIGHSP